MLLPSMLTVGINGFGRIGRVFLRQYLKALNPLFKITHINSPGSLDSYCHLLKWDTTYGPLEHSIDNISENAFHLNNEKITFSRHRSPQDINWDVDIVVEATGIFKTKEDLQKHIKNNVRHVILCAPGKDIPLFVYGVNHKNLTKENTFISNASCTTNCIAPFLSALLQNYKINAGFMTTVHAVTNDQKLLDSSHKDLRRARSAFQSIIPTNTGAAVSVGEVIPSLKGKLDGMAYRVPVGNVSTADLVLQMEQTISLNDLLTTLQNYSYSNVMSLSQEPLVSCDFNGRTESCIVDVPLIKIQNKLLKISLWYDNEAGYSARVVNLIDDVVSLWQK